MSKYYTFFDSPSQYNDPTKYYSQGSSPELLKQLLSYLKSIESEITSIQICSYLFNNEILYKELCRYADKGVKVQVITIPIDGYDDRSPQYIVDITSKKLVYNESQTKYSLARKIFGELYKNKIKNFDLFFFPHMFIRSENVNPFSRGDMPYSLHLKSLFIKQKNKVNTTILTSSGLAVRDRIKDEVLIICEDDDLINIPTEIFFNDLLSNSILITEFDFKADYTRYQIKIRTDPSNYNNILLSPFYENSPELMEEKLKQLVLGAKKRVFIAAQHISAFKYQIPKQFKFGGDHTGSISKYGFLNELLTKTVNTCKIKCISQTYVNSNGDNMGARKPANTASFKEFMLKYESHPSAEYSSNSNLHSKYIICDDTVIITSCNFTPTQFIYLKYVNIPRFRRITDLSYEGIFSEVGQFLIIKNESVTKAFLENFDYLWNSVNTNRHICH